MSRAGERLAPGRVRVGPLQSFGSLSEAAALAARSSFCLCPSGDAPSFTQRLYVAVLSGCVPVRVDAYPRWPADPAGVESAYPYAGAVAWREFVVEVGNWSTLHAMPYRGGPSGRADEPPRRAEHNATFRPLLREFDELLPRLLALEPTAADRRRRMRNAAHWLAFDAHASDGRLALPDAASAALREVAQRLLDSEADAPRLRAMLREAERRSSDVHAVPE